MPTIGCPLNLTSLDPSCEALKKVGGVKSTFYFGRRSEISALTYDATTKELTGFTMKGTAALYKATGRKFQNSGAYELQATDTGVRNFQQTFNARLYHSTQLERETLEGLANVDDLIVFAPTNAGQIEVYGLELGLEAATATGGTGQALADASSMVFAFQGVESKLPTLFQAPAVTGPPALTGLDASIAYLDALV